MPKIDPVPSSEAGWLLKMANRYSKRLVGKELEPSAVMAHNTPVLAAYGLFEVAFGRARAVPERMKMLADIKVAMMVGCPF